MLVTEIVEFPRHKTLNFFLAAGQMAEVLALSEIVLDWGRMQGCTKATMAGRKGWSRILASTGWSVNPLVLLEKPLDGVR